MVSGSNNPQAHTSKPFIALVLQGGGALGAYHVGAFRALAEAGYTPDWVTGVSIGAVNAALIAGNKPDERLPKLQQFWEVIIRPSIWDEMMPSGFLRWSNTISAMQALMFGQPNFSSPFFVNPYLAPPGTPAATSFYDNTPLRNTMVQLVNFSLINTVQMRMSLGVTKVKTGDLVFFDNTSEQDRPIGAEHVIASSSIPPLYPGTVVKGEQYWDGGIVANTPLEPVLADQDQHPERDTLVFMIDLWDGSGAEPRTMDEVMWRYNQIQFASRTDRHIREVVERENMRRAMNQMAQHLPAETLQSMPAFPDGTTYTYGNLDIVRITYHPRADQTSLSYVDFSRSSIEERQADGYADMKLALDQSPWTRQPAEGEQSMPLSFAVRASGDTPPAPPARAAVHHLKGGQLRSHF